MRKVLLIVLSLTLTLIALFGCSSQKDGEITKVSVSKSSGFGAVNQDFFAVFEEKPTISIFESLITNAVKREGKVDIALSEFDFEVVYSSGKKQGFHLWLGKKGQKSTLMHVVDTSTIYTISEDMTDTLIDLLPAP